MGTGMRGCLAIPSRRLPSSRSNSTAIGALSGRGAPAARAANGQIGRYGRKPADGGRRRCCMEKSRRKATNIGYDSLPEKLNLVSPNGPDAETPIKIGCLADSCSEPVFDFPAKAPSRQGRTECPYI